MFGRGAQAFNALTGHHPGVARSGRSAAWTPFKIVFDGADSTSLLYLLFGLTCKCLPACQLHIVIIAAVCPPLVTVALYAVIYELFLFVYKPGPNPSVSFISGNESFRSVVELSQLYVFSHCRECLFS